MAFPGLNVPTYIGRLIDPSVDLIHSRDMIDGGFIYNNRYTKHLIGYVCVPSLFGVRYIV